jgi:DNA-binding transcriptional LysR family regulator
LRLKQVEDFLAVVECGSIRGAARVLGVSQPLITRSVKTLKRTSARSSCSARLRASR